MCVTNVWLDIIICSISSLLAICFLHTCQLEMTQVLHSNVNLVFEYILIQKCPQIQPQYILFSKISWGACPQTPIALLCFAC